MNAMEYAEEVRTYNASYKQLCPAQGYFTVQAV